MLFQNAFEAAALTALAGIPNRYGYATDGRSFLLTHRVPLTPKIRRSHQVHYYLELLRPLGIPVEPEPPMLQTTPGEDAEAIEHLRAFGVDTKKVLIGLNPGSVYGTAKRSEEHTSELQSQSNLVCRLLLEKKKNFRTGGRIRI